jgi:hypothetical protein
VEGNIQFSINTNQSKSQHQPHIVPYSRECSRPAQRAWSRLNNRDDDRQENVHILSKHEPLSRMAFFPLVVIWLGVSLATSLNSNLCTSPTKQDTTENNCIISHAQTQLHFCPMCFQVEYIGYWSQTREGRLFPAQTTANVNCKLFRQYHYVEQSRWLVG